MNDSTATLIADAGGTSTRWVLIRNGSAKEYTTAGINPVVMDSESVAQSIGHIASLLTEAPDCVMFYGAGCRDKATCEKIIAPMRNLWGGIRIEVKSDLAGAAVALFGNRPGIACILGTGSNSGIYDGNRIIANTPPLGYILGDEGSGAAIGKAFLNTIFKGRLSETAAQRAKDAMKLSLNEIIEHVYREPMANRFLASLCPIVHSLLDCREVEELTVEQFRNFYEQNIVPYGQLADGLEIGFVGSVAKHFEQQLRAAIPHPVATIVADPLPEIAKRHLNTMQ